MFVELVAALGLGYFSVLPPVEYREDAVNQVAFIADGAVRNELCNQMVGKPAGTGFSWIGCASLGKEFMVVPNPCNYSEETYARHMCHELGHTNGWPGDHPRGEAYKFPQTSPQTSPKK